MKESERGFACLLTWGSSVEGVASAERNWFLRLEVGKQGRKQHLIINQSESVLEVMGREKGFEEQNKEKKRGII